MRHQHGRRIALLGIIVSVLLLSACVDARPYLVPGQEMEESEDNTPEPEVSATPSVTEDEDTDAFSGVDALGNAISGPEHYRQYLQLKNIQVYEECDDTFIDADLVSTYPKPLICAIEIVFYRDGIQIASSNLQTRDGKYVLSVAEGSTAVYGQVDTDISVTNLYFKIIFNEDVDVAPQ